MNANKILSVVRREFVERVHSKAFVITTILVPVLLLIMAVAPMLLMGQSDHTARVAVVDGTSGPLAQQVVKVLRAQKIGTGATAKPRYEITLVPAQGKADSVREQLVDETGFSRASHKGKYDGVLELTADTLSSGKLTYYGSNVSSIKAMAMLQSELSKAFASVRLTQAGISLDTVGKAMRPANLSARRVSEGKLTGQSGSSAFAVAYGMGFLLYIAIISFGARTMTSVIEEKTSRVMEVLVSSLTPFQMLMGKVLGVGSAGLLQMAIWGVSALLISTQASHLAGLFGISQSTLAMLSMLSISGSMVVVFLLYFILGFLLFGALYAAVGSMCNSTQETQQYATVVTVLILIGFLSMFGTIANPTGTLANVMSWIPFFSPFVMPVRWALTSVSSVNLAGSLVLLVIGMWCCVWLAARIYHTGILMFGKKPSWRELWRWIRVS
ncbi:MAG TPA: ABC transporter permease [Rhodanobacteraceae bacterium]